MDFYTAIHLERFMHGKINFQSGLHDDAKTWADAGSLKVKYLVNAGHFKRYL